MIQDVHFEEFNVDVLAETEKAFRFCFLDHDDQVEWVPKSVVEPPHSDIESDQFNVTVGIAEWWAKKEGLL